MDKPLNVVVIIGAPSAPGELFRSALGDSSPGEALSRASGRNVEVSLLSVVPPSSREDLASTHVVSPAGRPRVDRFLQKLPVDRVAAVLKKSPLGRLLLSLGPTDPSRVFWRSVQADPAAIAMLRSADVLLAADMAAIRTAWRLLRSGQVEAAFFGLQAAEKVFAARYAPAKPVEA